MGQLLYPSSGVFLKKKPLNYMYFSLPFPETSCNITEDDGGMQRGDCQFCRAAYLVTTPRGLASKRPKHLTVV